MNILMRRGGTDQIDEIPAEQQFTYQQLGWIYLGPVETPPDSKIIKETKTKTVASHGKPKAPRNSQPAAV